MSHKNTIQNIINLEIILMLASIVGGTTGWVAFTYITTGVIYYGEALISGMVALSISQIFIARVIIQEIIYIGNPEKRPKSNGSTKGDGYIPINPSRLKSPNVDDISRSLGRGRVNGKQAFLHTAPNSPHFVNDWVIKNGRWMRKKTINDTIRDKIIPPKKARTRVIHPQQTNIFDSLYFVSNGVQIPSVVLKKFLRIAMKHNKYGKGLSLRYWQTAHHAWWSRIYFHPILSLISTTEHATGLQLIVPRGNQWKHLLYDDKITFIIIAIVQFPELFSTNDLQNIKQKLPGAILQ